MLMEAARLYKMFIIVACCNNAIMHTKAFAVLGILAFTLQHFCWRSKLRKPMLRTILLLEATRATVLRNDTAASVKSKRFG